MNYLIYDLVLVPINLIGTVLTFPLAFIIGGAQVYEQALELDVVQQMIITEVDIDVVGDAHFPNFNQANWHETSRISFPSAADPKDPSRLLPAYAFVNYSRQI